MSQIRKIKRKHEKNHAPQAKGKSAFIWLVVMAVILIAVVAFLGFRNISTAPTPEVIEETGSQSEINGLEALSVTTASDETVLVSDVMNHQDQGSIFVFFLGGGWTVCTSQLVQLNQYLEEIQHQGYVLYGVSADTPAAHKALMERENLGFDLLSDLQLTFYQQAGIITGTDTGVRRGVVVYDSEGAEKFKEVTDDPATALLKHLNIED